MILYFYKDNMLNKILVIDNKTTQISITASYLIELNCSI